MNVQSYTAAGPELEPACVRHCPHITRHRPRHYDITKKMSVLEHAESESCICTQCTEGRKNQYLPVVPKGLESLDFQNHFTNDKANFHHLLYLNNYCKQDLYPDTFICLVSPGRAIASFALESPRNQNQRRQTNCTSKDCLEAILETSMSKSEPPLKVTLNWITISVRVLHRKRALFVVFTRWAKCAFWTLED